MKLQATIFTVSIHCILLVTGDYINVNHEWYNTEQFPIYPDGITSNKSMIESPNITTISTQIEFFSTTYGNFPTFNIYGYRPTMDGNYPLYIHLVGTSNSYWDTTGQYYTQYMTNSDLNFVSVSIEYAMWLYPLGCSTFIPHSFNNKAMSLWDTNNPHSAISVLCDQIPFINCNKGIVVSGFSQGAMLASQAAKYGLNEAITALYLIAGGDTINKDGKPFLYYECLSFHSLNIPQNKIRSIIHENDMAFGPNLEAVRRQQISITHHYECDHDHDLNDNDTNGHNCINQIDGSGFYILNKQALGVLDFLDLDHCYAFQRHGCIGPVMFNPIYFNTDELWGFKSNMNWLQDMVKNKTTQFLPIIFDTECEKEGSLLYKIFNAIFGWIVHGKTEKKKKKKRNTKRLNTRNAKITR
eukprot:13020_1